VRVGQADLKDLSNYANMFYDYRDKNVWSAPECLKERKKLVEPTWEMDAYSFGVLMWEVWLEKVPFDGDLNEAIDVVLK
jgi:hypothetical protein